jgi:hypothetical protein
LLESIESVILGTNKLQKEKLEKTKTQMEKAFNED